MRKKNGNNQLTAKKEAFLWRLYILIGFVAAVIVSSMGYIFLTGRSMTAVHAPLIDAAMEIKLEATTGHLWFEEIISGDRDETIESIMVHLDKADWYAKAMLEGGISPEKKFIPLKNELLRKDIIDVRNKLSEFRKITLQRWETKETSGIGTEIDQKYDALFKDFLALTDKVETDLQKVINKQLKNFQVIQISLIAVCLAVTAVVGIFFSRFMHRQIHDEIQLIAANQQLDASNQQLSASEQQLRASNQQLSASEQQLRALNQQLVANEQQLKAGNQQLVANEQQLRAANQQLVANEQQLRAANQQLVANEQQLRAANQQLTVSEKRFKDFFNNSPIGLHIFGPDQFIIDINDTELDMIGYSREEVVGKKKWQDIVISADKKRFQKHWDDIITKGHVKDLEYTLIHKQGYPIDVLLNASSRFDENNNLISTRGSVLNITKRKQAEAQIKSSLKEKELLLKEIHHRTKNNFQVISSMLYLQSEYFDDEKVFDVLEKSQNRIKSMAAVHEQLYKSGDLSSIDFEEYTRNLLASLYHSSGISAKSIAFQINIDQVFLGIDLAIPCGLIINELFSNSLKHAFPGLKKGDNPNAQISIDMHKTDGQRFTLVVSDNGISFAGGIDSMKGKSLGLYLVKNLTEQLDGTVELDTDNGTKFTIKFPCDIT